MPHAIPASFWRGGTSRGLLFRARDLAPYPQSVRDKILLTAMGSPDPDGRQIDGLGGGVSSLSKCAIISKAGEDQDQDQDHHSHPPFTPTPGPSYTWPDAIPHADLGYDPSSGHKQPEWDLVYRFAQIPVRNTKVDWGSTCGNMLAAAAMAALSDPTSTLVPYASKLDLCRGQRMEWYHGERKPASYPLRILSANSGEVLKARVPLNPLTAEVFEPMSEEEGVSIAGVPGFGAAVELEFPLGKNGLPTGKGKDVVEIEWEGSMYRIEVTISTAGLINIFIPLSALPPSLPSPSQILSTSPAELDTNSSLHDFLEKVREAGAHLAGIKYESGTAEPKVCLVGSGEEGEDAVARAVSVGNFHRTIPGTTLSALALALTHPTTIFPAPQSSPSSLRTIKVRHPAGVAEATLRLDQGNGKAEAVVVTRTAREVMRGGVLVPGQCFEG